MVIIGQMLPTILLNALIAAIGVTLIIGACRRWRWLVDPPIAIVPQTFLKRLFGPTVVVVYTCLLGAAIFGLAMWGIWLVCCRASY
jgi:hypothetical protein